MIQEKSLVIVQLNVYVLVKESLNAIANRNKKRRVWRLAVKVRLLQVNVPLNANAVVKALLHANVKMIAVQREVARLRVNRVASKEVLLVIKIAGTFWIKNLAIEPAF